MSRYAWVITQDCNDPYGESEFPPRARGTRVGVSGPASATPGELMHALRHGAFFRLVDADGHVSYIGRCWSAAGPDSEEMFGPLDDYGRADAAATEIRGPDPHTRVLHLRTRGDTLTLAATNGTEHAQIDLPGAVTDGCTAVAPAALISTLTATKPPRTSSGPVSGRARVTLVGDANRLDLTLSHADHNRRSGRTGGHTEEASHPGHPVSASVDIDVDIDIDLHTDSAVHTAAGVDAGLGAGPDGTADRPIVAPDGIVVADAPVGTWCELVTAVATAAARHPRLPSLSVVRFARRAGAALTVQATDRYRLHHAPWQPASSETAPPQPAAAPQLDVRTPVQAVGRAVRLLTACDPHGLLTVHADSAHILWRTATVRVSAPVTVEPFPDMDTVREHVKGPADVTFTVDHADMRAALDAAARLAAAATNPGPVRIDADPHRQTAVVSMSSGSGTEIFRTGVRAAGATRSGLPPCQLRLNPAFARDAFTFLPGPTVTVAATTGRLPVWLHSADRHVIIMQIRPA